MNINKLPNAVAKLEGKKSQARIGDIREIQKIMIQIMAEEQVKEAIEQGGQVYGSLLLQWMDRVDAVASAIRKKSEKAAKKAK